MNLHEFDMISFHHIYTYHISIDCMRMLLYESENLKQ